MGLGRALSRRGSHEEAATWFEKAIELAPRYADAHYELALELLAMGKQQAAVGELTTALRHNPQHGEAHLELGVTMLAQGKPAVALPQLRAAVRERPQDARAHYELARCCVRLGDHERAIASFREALRLRKDWPEASRQLAWVLATSPQDALRDGAEATRLADGATHDAQRLLPVCLDTLAAARAETANFDEALKLEPRAIEAAKALGDDQMRVEFEKRFDDYRKKKPYRETLKQPDKLPAAK
jgi:tetratricopeptide (TPR) repeat protein